MTGPEAKSRSFLTVSEANQTEQTESRESSVRLLQRLERSILEGGKIFHLYSLLGVLHYLVPPAKSLLLRQKTDFVVIAKQHNTTWDK